MPQMDEYEYLETASDKTRPVADLISWAYNETYPNTYTLFLDLIGWTHAYIGDPLYDLKKPLGWIELGYLSEALNAYCYHTTDVEQFIDGYEKATMEGAGV